MSQSIDPTNAAELSRAKPTLDSSGLSWAAQGPRSGLSALSAPGNGLYQPENVAVGPDGDLYVSGRDPVTLDYEVFVVHTDGTVELLFTPPDIWIASLATDSPGRIFNSQSDAIRVYEPNGMGGEAVNIAGVGDGMGNLILGPRGIAVGPNDEIYSVSFYEDSAFRAHSMPEPDMVAILAALIPALAALDRRRLRGAEG